MKIVPLIPENAPFSVEQRAWLNGFLAGVLNRGVDPSGAAPAKSKRPLLIAFGSQSGNAESLAKRLAREASGRGFAARAAGLDSLQPADLIKEQNVLLITSTWGEGDMPDNAVSFWDSLNQNGSSPKLEGVQYSILALGDKNYGDTFCLAGKKLDTRLAELGAKRIVDRVDCDVEFDDLAKKWSANAFTVLSGVDATASSNTTEAEEETGVKNFRLLQEEIFDIDIHPIPARKDMIAHDHYDIRFLLQADRNDPLIITEESHDLGWIKIEALSNYNDSPSLLRMVEKVKNLL